MHIFLYHLAILVRIGVGGDHLATLVSRQCSQGICGVSRSVMHLWDCKDTAAAVKLLPELTLAVERPVGVMSLGGRPETPADSTGPAG